MIQKQILRFKISVNDSIFVYIFYSWENLLHERNGLFLIQSFLFDDMIEKFSSLSVFHDEMDISFGLNDLNNCQKSPRIVGWRWDVSVFSGYRSISWLAIYQPVRLFSIFEGFSLQLSNLLVYVWPIWPCRRSPLQ